ncbi:D-amino acid dehydrogenase [Pluralibacter gergoviae]
MKKRIVIVGGGVIGLTTAYVLIKSGHQVHLIDRNSEIAQATSFANGGQLSYRYVAPLADKGVPLQGLKWMGKADSPLNLQLKMSVSQWRWLWLFLRACNSQTNKLNGSHILRLSLFSKQVMENWRQNDGLQDFAWRKSGKLIIHRRAGDFTKAAGGINPDYQQALDRNSCLVLEPSLKYLHPLLKGGIYSPGDETADCHKFCEALLAKLTTSPDFIFTPNCEVTGFSARAGRVVTVKTRAGILEGNEFVIAAGNGSTSLLADIGVRVALCSLKGYSLTLPYPDASGIAPDISVTDYANKIVYARLGEQLRVAAMVDIGYDDEVLRPERLAALKRTVRESFPELEGIDDALCWTGMRPSTPSGPPLIGRTGYSNLWMNIGQGSLGFTLAAGSAAVLGALIDGINPAISLEGLTWKQTA